MKRCVTISENPNDSCCNKCSNSMHSNCPCPYCEKLKIEDVDMKQISCMPIKYNKIIDSAKLCHSDFVVGKILTFYLDTPSSDYVEGDKVCINTIETKYDFIGLSQLLLNNSETFIDGESYYLTPENLFNAGTEDIPENLFDSLYGEIEIKTPCCCNLNSSDEFYSARVAETAKFFEVSNLEVTVKGFIGCRPFSATATVSEDINEGASNIRLTSLGLLSGAAFFTNMCIPIKKQTIYLKENFNSTLTAECIRLLNDYTPPPAGTTETGSFVGSVDFSIFIEKDIYLCTKEQGYIYSCKNKRLKS